MAVLYNGTTYYYVTNLQGDVIAILDTNGTAVVEYAYDAWGNLISTTGSMATTLGVTNPLRYRGYVFDSETNLYYLSTRYYDPEVGRFLNADAFASTGHGLLGNNMFAYCLNNPINCVDDTGTFPWLIATIIIGGAIIGGIWGATAEDNLSEMLKPQENEKTKSYNPLTLPTPTRTIQKKGPPYKEIPLNVVTPTTNRTSSNSASTSNNQQKLTVKERINNIIIGASAGLMIGGAAVFLGGAVACTAEYASVAVPALGMTGSQTVAWGLLAYDVFPIFVAPFLDIEMEVLEYPS